MTQNLKLCEVGEDDVDSGSYSLQASGLRVREQHEKNDNKHEDTNLKKKERRVAHTCNLRDTYPLQRGGC